MEGSQMGRVLGPWSVGSSWWGLREAEGTQPPPPNSPGQGRRQHWADPEAEPGGDPGAGVGFPAKEFYDNQSKVRVERVLKCRSHPPSGMGRRTAQEMTATRG